MPGQPVQSDRVGHTGIYTLSTFSIPEAPSAVFAATEYAPPIGHERNTIHWACMSTQYHSTTEVLDIPDSDLFVKARARQGFAIRTPDDTMHPLSMSQERMQEASIEDFPYLDRLV